MRSLLAIFLALCIAMASGGCASRRHSARAAAVAAEPVLLELKSEGEGPLRMTVEGVIVRNGPGSWRADAPWDEYRLVLANDGPTPVTIEGIDRVAMSGPPVAASNDIDELGAKTAAIQGLIAWGTVKTAGVAAGVAGAVGTVGSFYSSVGLTTMGAALSAVSFVMVPAVIVGGVVLMAKQGKRGDPGKLADGFAGPADLAAGDERRVNAFFPIMPTSTMLIARYRVAGEPRSAAVYLADWRGEEKNLASGCTMAELAAHAPPVRDRNLAHAEDDAIGATIESVLMRDSEESWAQDAHWDEYRIRIRSKSGPVTIDAVRLVDVRSRMSEANRPLCPDGKRLFVAARPDLRKELERRATGLPAAVDGEAMLDLFFSMSPPPVRVEIDYRDARGMHLLEIAAAEMFALPSAADRTPPTQQMEIK
jgi:hypothetical protein